MRLFFLVFFLGINCAFCQNVRLPIITQEQKDNANAIKISQSLVVDYKSFDKVNVINKYAVLVFNESGYTNLDISKSYDKSNKIKKLSTTIYNLQGGKIKQFNKSDFKDRSVTDEVSIFSDDRILQLDYTPLSYPFILEYECETESINTAFLKSWSPISSLYETVLESKLEIIKNPLCPVNVKTQKLEEYGVEKNELADKIIYSVKNILAIKAESYADYSREFPSVKMFLNKASLEGHSFDMSSWKEFGKKYYEYFILNNSTISEETKQKLDKIISPNDKKLDVLKKVYKYVQDNTRYISVQVGVGGWKPMEVSDVEKYGYGDCKALSNYTRAILKAYNVDSYYTLLYGGNKMSFEEDIVAKQSNHVILTVPDNDSYIFLECTSQTNPFGYQGEFTSNRNAFLLKPDGGEVIKTNFYKAEDNTQITKSKIFLSENGSILGDVEIVSKLTQYDNVAHLELRNPKQKLDYYKNHFGHLNNLEISNLNLINNKEDFSFTEKFSFKAQNYYENGLNSIILPLNVFNRFESIPAKQRNKRFSFEIDYGFTDTDELEILLPNNTTVTQLPEKIDLVEKFGEYHSEVLLENNKLIYKRKLIMKDGVFAKEDFESFRKFREQINKLENVKVIIDKL